MKDRFHVGTSIAYKYLIADKMRSTGEYFENIGDNVDTDKVSMLFKKMPPILLIQQDITDFFAFDQLQEKRSLIKTLKIKEMLTTITVKENSFYGLQCSILLLWWSNLMQKFLIF